MRYCDAQESALRRETRRPRGCAEGLWGAADRVSPHPGSPWGAAAGPEPADAAVGSAGAPPHRHPEGQCPPWVLLDTPLKVGCPFPGTPARCLPCHGKHTQHSSSPPRPRLPPRDPANGTRRGNSSSVCIRHCGAPCVPRRLCLSRAGTERARRASAAPGAPLPGGDGVLCS